MRTAASALPQGMDVVVVRDKDDRLGAVLLDARKWGKKAKVKKRRTDGDLLELVEAQPRGGVKGQGMQDPVPESESDEEAFGMASGGLAALGRLVRWMWGGIWEAEDVVGKRRWARDLNAGRRRRWGMAAWLEYAPFKVSLVGFKAGLGESV